MKIQRKKTLQKFTTHFVNWAAVRVNKLHHPPVIIVTGSVGKTTTRKAISEVLSKKYRVHRSSSSVNSKRGLRLHLFGIESMYGLERFRDWLGYIMTICWMLIHYPYDVVVLEVAENYVNSSLALLREINPVICVVTGVADAHMEHLGDRARLMKNLRKLAECCEEVMFNADFPDLNNFFESNEVHSYGVKTGQYHAESVVREQSGYLSMQFDLGNGPERIATRTVAHHLLAPLVIAAQIGIKFGVEHKDIATTLEGMTAAHGRMNLMQARCGARVIDDSYNANLISAKSALEELKDLGGYRVAVIGSMNELGDLSDEHHRELALIATSCADLILFVGNKASDMRRDALSGGFVKDHVLVFNDARLAGTYLQAHIESSWTILFKGSGKDVYLEEAIQMIIPPEEVGHLVRQSPNYRRRKEQFFASVIDN